MEDRARIEERWRDDSLAGCRRGTRIFGLLIIALFALSAVYSAFAEPELFVTLLRIRLAAAAAVATVVGLVGTPWGERRSRELALVMMFVVAVALHALALETGGQASRQYDRMSFLVLGPSVLMLWDGWWSLTSSATVIGVYLAGSLLSGALGGAEFVANLGRLTAAATVTIAISSVRERYRWRDLWQRQALAEAHRRADGEIRRLNEQLEQRVVDRTAELRASEQRVRAMFDSAPIGVVTVSASGRILEANAAFSAMLCDSAERLPEQSITDLTVPEYRGATAAACDELRSGKRDVLALDKRYLCRDGGTVNVHEVMAAIRDENGSFAYSLVMVEDVGERVRAEERAREHEERLAHVLRMGTMGEMASELAHELNQPLGAIVNFANGAAAHLRRAGAESEVVGSVTRISAEAFRAAEILRRVRDFVRPGRRRRETVSLNALVRDVALICEADARRHHVQLRLRLDSALPEVSVDAIQIEQVVVNLIRNAIDALKESPQADHELVVETQATPSGVELRVRDTGPGIAPTERARIFDAYYTTKSGGLGMGLSISRTIVEGHGGRIWVGESSDRGTTVAFSLPIKRESAAIPLAS